MSWLQSQLSGLSTHFFFFLLGSGAFFTFLAGGFFPAGFFDPIISHPYLLVYYPDLISGSTIIIRQLNERMMNQNEPRLEIVVIVIPVIILIAIPSIIFVVDAHYFTSKLVHTNYE